MRKVEIVPYQEIWSNTFEEEARRIRRVFGNELVHIYHIGSTAIHGMAAKPVIDHLVVVRDIQHVDYFNKAMEALGYLSMGENGIQNRRFFQKGGNQRTHHVHVFQLGSKEVGRHLLFRDYLRAHSDAAKEYQSLKEKLAKDYSNDIKRYMEGKNGFIQTLDIKAYEWADKINTAVGFVIKTYPTKADEYLVFFTNQDEKRPWGVPGGRIEEGETPEQGLIREIREESGLETIRICRKLGTSYYYRPEKYTLVSRHDYILECDSNLPPYWTHVVYGQGDDAGDLYHYQWVPKDMLSILDEELHFHLNKFSFPELFNK